jgi:hypothetical protein
MKSTLSDVQVIKDFLRRGTDIEVDGGVKTKDDYVVFGVIRKTDAPFLDIEAIAHEVADKSNVSEDQKELKFQEKYDELIEKYAELAEAMKLESGSAVGRQNGFYVVPFYPGMTQVRALRWYRVSKEMNGVKTIKDKDNFAPKKVVNEYNRLALDVVLFDIPEGVTFPKDTECFWGDNPKQLLNYAAMLAKESYVYESTIKLKSNDEVASQLHSFCKMRDTVMKVRINMGNTITNACFALMGKEKFDALKNEFLEKDPNTTYIKEAYKEFRQRIENPEISERTGQPKRINRANYNPSALIPKFRIWEMLKAYDMQVRSEDHIDSSIKELVIEHPFWNQYLEGIKGCGYTHAGYLIAGLDPTICRHPSGWIRYLGLDVVWNEKYQKFSGRNKKFLRPVPLVTDNGTVQMVNTLGYNTELKSRVWLLATNILMAGDPHYKQVYQNAYAYYSNRDDLKQVWDLKAKKSVPKGTQLKLVDPDGNEVGVDFNKAAYSSAYQMALRKVMTTFITDLWIAERRILGLPINGGRYEEEKLGKKHGFDHTPVHWGWQHTPNVINPIDLGPNPYDEDSYFEATVTGID